MLGRTHFAVGVAAGLLLIPPKTFPALAAGIGLSALGGVLPDIDSGTSEAHKDADKIMAVSILAAGGAFVAEAFFHVGLFGKILQNGAIARAVIAALVFLLVCAFGKEQPHRSFMHSILALLILTACIAQIFPDAAAYFAVGFASHLAIDLLNRKREKLFYPIRRGICFFLCSSRGLVNRLLLALGILASAALILTSIPVRNAVSMVLPG